MNNRSIIKLAYIQINNMIKVSGIKKENQEKVYEKFSLVQLQVVFMTINMRHIYLCLLFDETIILFLQLCIFLSLFQQFAS